MLYDYNYARLLGLMREKNVTQLELAKGVNISTAALNNKLRRKRQFTQTEMKDILGFLDVGIEHIPEFFYQH